MVALLFSEALDVVKVHFPACPAQEVTGGSGESHRSLTHPAWAMSLRGYVLVPAFRVMT